MEILCSISYREKNTFEVTNCDLKDGGAYRANDEVKTEALAQDSVPKLIRQIRCQI